MGEIKKISNQSDFTVSYIKMEQMDRDYGRINPNDTKLNVNMWFPWVEEVREFTKKVIIVEVLTKVRIFFWESGDYVYYSMSKQNLDGPYDSKSNIDFLGDEYFSGKIAPGGKTKGRKELEIRNDGDDITFKLYDC